MDTTKCFFAYSSDPLDTAETIELAIDSINETSPVYVQGWKSLGVTGKIIIDRVTNFIDVSDHFICDLTTLSLNVLFELGYAIAKGKRIWITLNSSFEDAKRNYKKLSILSTMGYISDIIEI